MTSGQELIQRLREQVQHALAQRTSAIESDLTTFQELVASKVEGIRQKLEEPAPPELPIEGTIAGVLESAEKLQAELAREATDRTAQLAECACRMRIQETQEEILTCLADAAACFAPRLAVMLVRPEGCAGWTARGLPGPALSRIRELFVETGRSRLLARAVEAGAASVDAPEESPLAETLGSEGPWHAVCLRAMGRSVAVLAAAGSPERPCDAATLQVLVELAGLNLENMALRVMQEVRATAPPPQTAVPPAPPAAPEAPVPPVVEAVPVPEHTPEAAAPPEAEAAPQVEQSITEAPPAEVAVPAEVEAPPEPEPVPAVVGAAEPAADEASARTAIAEIDRTLESIRQSLHEIKREPAAAATVAAPQFAAPFEAVPAVEPTPEPPAMQPPPAPAPEPPPVVEPERRHLAASVPYLQPVQKLAEEEKLHTDAKRFARLLVSEIKLYNERRVLEGRENRDIYVRLKRDIDRSRDVYDKRVSPAVSRKVDYFHDEVIRILGDNDPTTLGSDYPGPRVES